MRDRRPVDELSLDELERIVAIRRREARQERLIKLREQGRRLPTPAVTSAEPEPVAPPQQHEAAYDLEPLEPPVTYDLTDELPRFEDDPDDGDDPRPVRPVRLPAPDATEDLVPRRRVAYERLLLMVEVLGIVGMIAVLIVGVYLVQDENDRLDALEEESAAIQREAAAMRATPTPAPALTFQLADYVLPGGHYSPVETGGQGAFNLEELPASVRPQAMAMLSSQQAIEVPQQDNSPATIVIDTDRVYVNASIFPGDDWFALEKGVGHFLGSAKPGENGNMVLSAHNDIYGEIFRYIQYLEPGDEIKVQTRNGVWYTYVVRDKFPVDPTEVWVLERGNTPMVTLITCHPYRVDNQRMIVQADLRQG